VRRSAEPRTGPAAGRLTRHPVPTGPRDPGQHPRGMPQADAEDRSAGCVRAVAGSVVAVGSACVREWRDGGAGGCGGVEGGRTRRHVRGDGVERSLRSILGAARAVRFPGSRGHGRTGRLAGIVRPRGDVRRRAEHHGTASHRGARIGTPNGPICGVPHRPAGIRRRSGGGSGNQPANRFSPGHPAIRPSGRLAVWPSGHPATILAKYGNARMHVASKGGGRGAVPPPRNDVREVQECSYASRERSGR
jgi:hypothetical protein